MTKPANHCDECKHFYYHVGADVHECMKGHKPRFYKPHWIDKNTSWGWKRKCEDFKDADHEPRKP